MGRGVGDEGEACDPVEPDDREVHVRCDVGLQQY